MKKKGERDGIKRRDFLKKAGTAAAVAGVAQAAPRFVKPAFAATKDHVLLGRVQPMTGPAAAFSEASPWVDERAMGEINKAGGFYIEELGKSLPLKAKFVDTESVGTKSAEVTARLVSKDKVDVVYVSSTPETCNPAAQQCERHKVPCLGNDLPVEMFLAGGPYNWAVGLNVCVGDFMAAFIQMWSDVSTNKIVGLIAANDVDAVAFANGANGALPGLGYTVIDAGRFPCGNSDFSSLINQYRKEEVDILFGNLAPPDFTTAWRQCFQMGWMPKVCTIGRALLFPSAVEALGGDLGIGTSTEAIWHRSYGFKSTLADYTTAGLCDAFEDAFDKQWTAPLGHLYAGYEFIADAYKRTKSLDKDKVRQAMSDTKMTTICGPAKKSPDGNAFVVPSGGIQWVKGTKWPFDQLLVANGNYPKLPVDCAMKSVQQLRG